MDKYKGNAIRDSEVIKRAPAFFAFYKSLKSVMKVREQKLLAKQPKRDSHSSSMPTTPRTPENQWTRPRDPNHTGSSTQSKDEDYTKELLSMLLMCSLGVLDQVFQRLSWVRSAYEVLLDETFPLTWIGANK